MNHTPPLRVLKGLAAAALTAWVMIIGYIFLNALIDQLSGADTGAPLTLLQGASILAVYAIFGIPVALAACIVVGYPAWRIAELCGLESPRGGLLGGLICGAIIAALSTATRVLSTGPGSSWGGSKGNNIEDGHLTALGWTGELHLLLWFLLVGACAGYIAVWVARQR